MINAGAYTSIIRKNKRLFIALMASIVLASTAIGVQRTILALYTDTLSTSLERFILLSGAIALSIYGFSKAIGNYTGGYLSERLGRKITVRLGLLMLVIGSFTVLLATNLALFLLANLVIGTGIGIFLATTTVMFTDLSSSRKRARSISMMELSVYGGTSLGSIVAGIVSGFGYLYSFAVAFILVVGAILVSLLLSETKSIATGRNDKTVKKRAKKILRLQDRWRDMTEDSILETEDLEDLYAKLDLKGDNLLETHTFNRHQFFHPSIMITFSTGLISRISDSAIILLLPLFLVTNKFSALELGIITSSFTLMWAVGMYISGPLSDQVGRKQPVLLGLLTELTGLSILLLPGLSQQFAVTMLAIVIAGTGRGIYYALPASIVSDQVDVHQRPKVLGIYRFFLDFGYVIGSILLVILIEPALFGQTGSEVDVFSSALIVVVFFLLIQSIMVGLFLRDPKPQFRQLDRLDKHLLQVQRSISLINQSVVEFNSGHKIRSKILMDQAKIIEQKADKTLEQIIENTYSGALRASDGIELLEFAQKMDKALGHSLRAIKQLQLIEMRLSPQINIRISKFAVLLDFMMLEAVEVIKLLPIKISVASQQSYQVNRLEETLDNLYQLIWEDAMDLGADGLESVLLVNSIESMEKSANTIEDAVQLIRLIGMKHKVL